MRLPRGPTPRPLISFNGAAAKSSGKSGARMNPRDLAYLASMGPPLKAAENPDADRSVTDVREALQWGRR